MNAGEIVELYTIVEAGAYTPAQMPRVRFDILKQDFLFTGGLDDAVVSYTGSGAIPPATDFPRFDRTTDVRHLTEGEDLAEFVSRYARPFGEEAPNRILVVKGPGSKPSIHFVTWWQVWRLEQQEDERYYYIVNIDDELEDQSETLLQTRMGTAPSELERQLIVDTMRITGARWGSEVCAPGKDVELLIDGWGLNQAFSAQVEVYSAAPPGDVVSVFDLPLGGRPPYRAVWTVPWDGLADAYSFRAGLQEQLVYSANLLKIHTTLRSRFVTPGGKALQALPYRVLDGEGRTVRTGQTGADGLLVEKDLTPSANRVEIDEALVFAADDPKRADTEIKSPPAMGLMLIFYQLPSLTETSNVP